MTPIRDPNYGFYAGNLQDVKKRSSFLSPFWLFIVMLVSFIIILWYAYPRGADRYDGMDVPIIRADTDPYKIKPDDPGGMYIPHRDSTVFEPLEMVDNERRVEHLLSDAEEPMDRPISKTDRTLGLNLETTEGLFVEKDMNVEEGVNPNVDIDSEKDVSIVDTEITQVLNDGIVIEIEATTAPLPVAVSTVTTPRQKPIVKAVPKPAIVAETVKVAPKEFVKPAVGDRYIQLGAFRDYTAAQDKWVKVLQKNKSLLSGLTHKIQRADLGAKGIYYRLQAGTVTENSGRNICAKIKGSACILVKK